MNAHAIVLLLEMKWMPWMTLLVIFGVLLMLYPAYLAFTDQVYPYPKEVKRFVREAYKQAGNESIAAALLEGMIEHNAVISDELEGYLADEIQTICHNCDSEEARTLMATLANTRGLHSGHVNKQAKSFSEFRDFITLSKKQATIGRTYQ